jgi:hypothetical protein
MYAKQKVGHLALMCEIILSPLTPGIKFIF